jgi:hypothetical protein
MLDSSLKLAESARPKPVRPDQHPADQEDNDLRDARPRQQRHHDRRQCRHQRHDQQVIESSGDVHCPAAPSLPPDAP